MPTDRDINDLRLQKISEARGLVDRAEEEKRGLNEEERKQFDKLFKEADDLKETISRSVRAKEAEKALGEIASASPALEQKANAMEYKFQKLEEMEERMGENRASADYNKNFRNWMIRGELRALQADVDTAGGYVLAPLQVVDRMLKNVDDEVVIASLATNFTLKQALKLGVPKLTADPADSDWTSELLTGSEDSTMAFGFRELEPKPTAKRIKISNKLLQHAPKMDAFVLSRLAYKFAITEEKSYMIGNGVDRPLGLFIATALGISTSRDLATGNSTTAFVADNLISQKYNLKMQYHKNARWLLHRDGVSMAAKLKGSDNNYLWQPGLSVGVPDRLVGFPVVQSEYCPNTFTTGQYVGMLGDFSNYWIVRTEQLAFQRLVELYAETNQVGFIGRMEVDGMPVLEEAFTRIKLG